ncbi:hypothetical protein NQ318_011872, partial [Aromia moschata]
FGVPLEIASNTVVVGWAFRASYNLPTNISQLVIRESRKRRSLSRWDVYEMLEKDSEMRGHGGKSCILRLICEESNTPLDKNNGLFEELLHILFTPRSADNYLGNMDVQEYYKAQDLGKRHNGTCNELFPNCLLTHLDPFTKYSNFLNISVPRN